MGHVTGIILEHGGRFGGRAGWGFHLGHGSLQGGVEDLGFGEVLEGQAQSAKAGNADRAVSEQPAEKRLQNKYSLNVFQWQLACHASYEAGAVNQALVGQGDLAVHVRGQDDEEKQQRRKKGHRDEKEPENGKGGLLALGTKLADYFSHRVEKNEEWDCGKQKRHEQQSWQRENARMEAFLSQNFLIGMDVGEWVHGRGGVCGGFDFWIGAVSVSTKSAR